MKHVAGDVCPHSVLDIVIPTEHHGIDAYVFDKGLKSRVLRRAVCIFAEQVKAACVGRDAVDILKMHACACYGVIPYGVRVLLSVGGRGENECARKEC